MSLGRKIRKAHNEYFDALHDIATCIDTIRTGRIVIDDLEECVVRLGEILKREGIKLVREAA